MTEADAENRLARGDQVAQDRNRISRGRRRVTGTIRQKNAVGPMAQHSFGGGGGGNHGHLTAMRGKHSQDVALGAIIDRDNVTARVALQTIAALAVPHRLSPIVGLAAADFLGEIHALETGPIEGLRPELCKVEPPLRLMSNDAVGRSEIADAPGQAPRVHARNTDQPVMFEPGIQRLRSAIVGRRADWCTHDEAAGGRRRGFDVFAIGADIADMGEGEGDDLPGVRRVRQDLLVASYGGIETDFPDCRPVRADPATPKYRPVRKNERSVAIRRSRR